MSNPTNKYQWSFPTENQDPWFAQQADFNQSVDTTVNSIDQLMRNFGRTVLVISCYPSVGQTWTSSVTNPAANFSTVLSAAPYGRLAGTFTVPASGCQVRLEYHTAAGVSGTAGSGQGMYAFFRLIDANSINLTGDSSWVVYHRLGQLDLQMRFTTVVSLAAGTYTVEAQQRLVSDPNTSSKMSVPTINGHMLLWATVQPRG